MTNQHPITPPPELLDRWNTLPCHLSTKEIFVMVARWGADQELEACCDVMRVNGSYVSGGVLRAARRPKPPSDKEMALAELDRLIALIPTEGAMAMAESIRKALKALPNDLH